MKEPAQAGSFAFQRVRVIFVSPIGLSMLAPRSFASSTAAT
jgi:hypothetical protein